MKIERLIAILIYLLLHNKVTATHLAHRFEVSKRTIYRDITDLTLAGVPILTSPGSDGGIQLNEDYTIDKTIFSKVELQAILSGLQSLDSVSMDNKYQTIMDKFSANSLLHNHQHMLLNLSSHYKDTLSPKIHDIQESIEHLNPIKFTYYNAKGTKHIMIEPYIIVFQWSSWYVFGFEVKSGIFKMYKLNRLWELQRCDETFELREIPQERLAFDQFFSDEINVTLHFDPSLKYRLIEEYGEKCYHTLDNGKLCFTFPFTSKDYLFEWVLQFGHQVELIKPHIYRSELKEKLLQTLAQYDES